MFVSHCSHKTGTIPNSDFKPKYAHTPAAINYFFSFRSLNINGLYQTLMGKEREVFHTGQTRHRWTEKLGR
jgi:hypothetical protein